MAKMRLKRYVLWPCVRKLWALLIPSVVLLLVVHYVGVSDFPILGYTLGSVLWQGTLSTLELILWTSLLDKMVITPAFQQGKRSKHVTYIYNTIEKNVYISGQSVVHQVGTGSGSEFQHQSEQ